MTGAEEPLFVLPSSLDLPAAGPLCRQLQEQVLSGGPVLLDGAAVDRVSTPCLQVLVAARRSTESRGLRFELRDPSAALTNALADLGLQGFVAGEEM
jgi:anti-anti-sigma regulatory factor